MSKTLVTAAPQVLTDPDEIKHILRWRQYQQWIKSLPPRLSNPTKGIRNPECEALGEIQSKNSPKL